MAGKKGSKQRKPRASKYATEAERQAALKEARRAAAARFRAAHPEKAKRTPEQHRAKNARYKERHPDRVKAAKRTYDDTHKAENAGYARFRRKTRKPGQVNLDPKALLRRWTGQRRRIQDRQRQQRDAILVPLRVMERDARDAFAEAQRNFQKLAGTMAPARRASAEAGLRSLYGAWQQAQRRLRDAMK